MTFESIIQESPFINMLPNSIPADVLSNSLPVCLKVKLIGCNNNDDGAQKTAGEIYVCGKLYDHTYVVIFYNYLFNDIPEPFALEIDSHFLDKLCELLNMQYILDLDFKPMLTVDVCNQKNEFHKKEKK